MGTTVSVVSASSADRGAFVEAIRSTESTFRAYEERFSRFLETSELSRVNSGAGSWTSVSDELSEMLGAALDGARRSDGLFDPTVLPALVAAGYDRDFNEVLSEARSVLQIVDPCGRWRDVEREGTMVRLPPGVALDFGGIAKGWTVDVAATLGSEVLPWVLVEAGGDLRVEGDVGMPGLDVALQDPHDPTGELLRFRLSEGALATSSVTRRSWGPHLHHLIDPRTGQPSRTGVVQATAWAPTCREAELLSTWALLAGRPILDRIEATLVLDDGTVVTNMPWGAPTETDGAGDERTPRAPSVRRNAVQSNRWVPLSNQSYSPH